MTLKPSDGCRKTLAWETQIPLGSLWQLHSEDDPANRIDYVVGVTSPPDALMTWIELLVVCAGQRSARRVGQRFNVGQDVFLRNWVRLDV